MVREYIGARYVPKFTGLYDNTQSYEALCVVDNGVGTTYISKIPTPAGTPLTNTTYWAVYGASSGAIIDLQNRMTTVENDIANIPTQRHIIICGDSYVQGIGGDGYTIESAIESITNWDVRRFYSGGCGYIRINAEDKRMYEVVEDAIEGTTDKEVITDVVLAASVYNDTGMSGTSSFNESSFKTAIANINTLIKNNFPNARVTVIPSLWINVSYNTDFIKIWQWTKSAAQAIGANYAKQSLNWLTVYDSTVDSGDHVHPSMAGYEIIGNHIATVLNGNEPALYNGVDVITTASNDNITIKYYDDHAHIRGTISKEEGQSFQSLFNVPQALQKLTNFPIPFVSYGAGVVKYFLITNATTYFASDWLDVGTNYLIDCDVPYNNMI